MKFFTSKKFLRAVVVGILLLFILPLIPWTAIL